MTSTDTTTGTPGPDESRHVRTDGEVVDFPYNTTDSARPRPRDPVPAVVDGEVVTSTVDTAYEIELDDVTPAGPPTPVDTATVAVATAGPVTGTTRPIIPPHLRPENLKATASRGAGRAWHITRYHAVRSPWYTMKLATFAVRGLARVAAAQLRWWWVRNSFTLEQHAADSRQLIEWERIHRQIRATRMWRGSVLTAELLALGLGGPVVWSSLPTVWQAVVAAGCTAALARHGRPAGQTVIGTATVAPRFRKLNADIVLRAYYAAGLGHASKPDQQIQFGSAMSRDARNIGSQVVIDLPWGKGWSDVMGVREKIASGLDVHVNQVFLTPDRSSARRHMLFVADRDPLAVAVGTTDMVDGKPRSVWRPVRFGKDERGGPVELALMWVSVLVGAQPRKGKTFSARLIALHAALDPFVKLFIVDGKNSPDWIKFRMVAHRVVFGTHPNPNDTDPIEHLVAVLDEILVHIERVNQVLATLPVSVCPEGKLTEELARDPRHPDLRVVVLVMEEFQVYFETEDQAVNKDIAAKLSRIQAVGPSAGVCILSSSQKPSGVGAGDVGRLFNRYRDNHSVRFALKCGNRLVSEAVLGGDAYAEGYDASSLPVGKEYLGVGYLYGQSDLTPTVRTFLADHGDADRILTAARAHRERLGTLTGMAAGEEIERHVRDVLGDVRTAFGADARLPWQILAARMAESMSEHYADLTAEAISAQLRGLGVPSVNLKWDGAVLKGAKATDVTAAASRRDTRQ